MSDPPATYLTRPSAALLIAVIAVLAAAAWSIWAPYATIEPDDYSYRAQIAALRSGHLTLSKEQYQELDTKLRARTDRLGTSTTMPRGLGGGGIVQWVEQPDGRFISEKNPGWSFVGVGFDAAGLMRVINAVFLALAATAVWIATRRWIGVWAATLAVVLLAWSPFTLVFSTRVWMPTYAGAMLVATGLALAVWVLAATDRSAGIRTAALAGAVGAISLATWIRYTDLLVLGALGMVMIASSVRGISISVPRMLACGLIGVVTVGGIALFNAAHYGAPQSTGYALTQADRVMGSSNGHRPPRVGLGASSGAIGPGGTNIPIPRSGTTRSRSGGPARTDVTFSLDAVSSNIRGMPQQLAHALPQSLIAILTVLLVVVAGWWRTRRQRADLPALALLAVAWALPWGLYLAYDWTTRQAGVGTGGWVHTTRFYASAVGPIALLAAWSIARIPHQQAARAAGVLSAITCIALSVSVAGSTDDLRAGPGGVHPPGLGPGPNPDPGGSPSSPSLGEPPL